MKFWLGIVLGVLFAGIGVGGFYLYQVRPAAIVDPLGNLIAEKPLVKYSIERLAARQYEHVPIIFDQAVATESAYTVWKFHYLSDGRTVTGLAHTPNNSKPDNGYPVIVQFRGYVDREIFESGIGTKRSAEVFAANGFISLAPDFLGYGNSEMPENNIFEERFQTYTAALNLLSAVKTLTVADASRIGIWGHSNGGQIALTTLAVAGIASESGVFNASYPTTLWAPVSKPFPYSILYYTDEAHDRGKFLRKKLAEFEAEYDVEAYTFINYLYAIQSPIQLHQGSLDDAVPIDWSSEFYEFMIQAGRDIDYYTYPGADHNLSPSWNTVVERDIEFFQEHFSE